jgi:hypothetical protein
MKKLLTICFIMATVFTVNAQDKKPTKEETVAFINRTLNEIKGIKLPFASGVLQNASFSLNTLTYSTSLELNPGEKFCDHKEIYEDISWDKLIVNEIEFTDKANFASFYFITLDSNISLTLVNENCNNPRQNSQKRSYQSSVQIFIPIEKKESIKKAFLRLSEIAKEENKDPFKD